MANKNLTADLPDSEKDKTKLKQEDAFINLPGVEDIPGQENIHVPQLREMADTTISSDDEEGAGLFGEDDANSNGRLPVEAEIEDNSLAIIDEADLDAFPGGNNDEANESFKEDDFEITDDTVDEDADVTEEEKEALERTENTDSEDNENLYRSELDDEDFDGEKLNVGEDFSGDDLDIPGVEDDDEDEAIGGEDEENNAYSLGDNE